MRVAVLTPTRDRPTAFALCERWMSAQSDTDFTWIVVDDGDTPVHCTMGQTVIRREPGKDDPPHTLALNIMAAMPTLESFDAVIFVEDDDWYGPEYVTTMKRWLKLADLVGEADPKYYFLGLGYRRRRGHSHASLCRTGLRRSVLPTLADACKYARKASVDIELWALWKGPKHIDRDPQETSRLHVGMKGMPGRENVYRMAPHSYMPDPEYVQLKTWMGDDWRVYAELASEVQYA